MDQRAELARRVAVLVERRRLAGPLRGGDLGEGPPLERRSAGERLVGDHAERVEITRCADVVAGRLLRRHVRRRPGREAVEHPLSRPEV